MPQPEDAGIAELQKMHRRRRIPAHALPLADELLLSLARAGLRGARKDHNQHHHQRDQGHAADAEAAPEPGPAPRPSPARARPVVLVLPVVAAARPPGPPQFSVAVPWHRSPSSHPSSNPQAARSRRIATALLDVQRRTAGVGRLVHNQATDLVAYQPADAGRSPDAGSRRYSSQPLRYSRLTNWAASGALVAFSSSPFHSIFLPARSGTLPSTTVSVRM